MPISMEDLRDEKFFIWFSWLRNEESRVEEDKLVQLRFKLQLCRLHYLRY